MWSKHSLLASLAKLDSSPLKTTKDLRVSEKAGKRSELTFHGHMHPRALRKNVLKKEGGNNTDSHTHAHRDILTHTVNHLDKGEAGGPHASSSAATSSPSPDEASIMLRKMIAWLVDSK